MNLVISNEDVLREVFNISVGQSASILSEIIDKKILLNVPDVKILHLKDSKSDINAYLNSVVEGTIMVSSISFQEDVAGKASLIFPADKMRNFINLCMHENHGHEYGDLNFTDVDFDIIKEVGNIILNSIIGELGNYLYIKFSYSLPEVQVFNNINIEEILGKEEYTYILMLYITFDIEDSKIEGAIAINLTLNSLEEIMTKINTMVDDVNG
ncbi:chemotaxis protein CheC [Petroclostridium sp. X23]|uniref:chemotaxis protein CheC n=1 Tax=Petroclostridium sp. X23 TaxID=3045146 RepID=UPI0024ACCB4B|nr:chemotaxis protein CheC [Petroclostridium sp. X23]WHH59407.1 chemotaxis protein CheC [Petroclostridium sp. X23]